MNPLSLVQRIFTRFFDTVEARERQAHWSRFTCGDCERRTQCGLLPDANCIVKAAQIERGLFPAEKSVLYGPTY